MKKTKLITKPQEKLSVPINLSMFCKEKDNLCPPDTVYGGYNGKEPPEVHYRRHFEGKKSVSARFKELFKQDFELEQGAEQTESK